MRQAALNIRNWEGAPACRVTSPESGGWYAFPVTLKVEATTPDEKGPVISVEAYYSLDGALT